MESAWKRATRPALIIPAAALALSGCVSKDMSDLEAEVQRILARPGGGVAPLPPLKPPKRYLYRAADLGLRSPFESAFDTEASDVAGSPADDAQQLAYQTEILTHTNREELEQFPIDALRMVGIMENDEQMWGIIRDPEGSVHRVRTGNYLGMNYGKILSIAEDGIEVREIIKNAQGEWEERNTEVALSTREE